MGDHPFFVYLKKSGPKIRAKKKLAQGQAFIKFRKSVISVLPYGSIICIRFKGLENSVSVLICSGHPQR